MSSHKPTYEVHNGVSTEDIPSAAFGWSKFGRTGIQIAGWFSVFALVMLNFGNHQGHVETVWLISLAVIFAVGLLIHLFDPKLPQVRTLTGHNREQGHVEPDWAYDQKTLGGAYSDLSDDELRAMNIDPRAIDAAGKHAIN